MMNWTLKVVQDLFEVYSLWDESRVVVAGFDTESNGLHIINCRPFLFQFGWVERCEDGTLIGRAFAVDLDTIPNPKRFIEQWHLLAKKAPVYAAHNTTFDLSMLINIGVDYREPNISDGQFYIRLGTDNIQVDKGGAPLALKLFAQAYIDPNARYLDKQLQQERADIAKHYNAKLKETMGLTLKAMALYFDDSLFIPEELPSDLKVKYDMWHSSLPPWLQHTHGTIGKDDIPYSVLNRATVLQYSMYDIVYLLELIVKLDPIVKARGNADALAFENSIIYDCLDMERQGLTLDVEYVSKSNIRMRDYIRQRRQDFKDAIGGDIKPSQSKVILAKLQEAGWDIASTGSDALSPAIATHEGYPLVEAVKILQELRTLEKWYSTYLLRFLGQSKIYTKYNQVGAVSLRFTSDFQQFPKKGLKTYDGQELFNPRRSIRVPFEEGFDATVYYDYSQIELRGQALYTLLLGAPDTNLCRAYMPLRCTGLVQNNVVEFDPYNPTHIAEWNNGTWKLNEDTSRSWTPTDVHGATTTAAFGLVPGDPEYDSLRSMGKRVNFAKNYGAQAKRIGVMFPGKDEDFIKQIDAGYYKAFPGIKVYQEYCYTIAKAQPSVVNLFGVRYWNVSGHNLINMLIQGSSATLLKRKIREASAILAKHKAKTKLFLNVHDELGFLRWPGEQWILDLVQKAMQDIDWPIPIVADREISYTYWSDKEDF